MQELRFVAVSEDGSYAVLAVPGRSGRFILPIDERLRAVAMGQTSRLAQYEIEVESPLRPKEIQARIRAGETAEEIADAAGIPVERVRWFEGPVLAERAYIADQAQAASVRRAGDSGGPGPRLGDIVPERLTASGAEPEDGQWDSRKRGDGNWQVTLTFPSGGRLHVAEWIFDSRRRHVMPDDDNAARLSLPESELPPEPVSLPGEATVTPLAPRLGAAAGMGGGGMSGGFAGGGSGVGVRSFRPERSVIPDRSLSADRSLADRSLADRSLADRSLADRPLSPPSAPVHTPASAGASASGGDRPVIPDRPAMSHSPAAPPAPPRPAHHEHTAFRDAAQDPVAYRDPAPEQPPYRTPAPEQHAPEQHAPEQHAPEQRAPEQPAPAGTVPVTAPPYVFEDLPSPAGHAPSRHIVFEDPEPAFRDEQLELAPASPGASVASPLPQTPAQSDERLRQPEPASAREFTPGAPAAQQQPTVTPQAQPAQAQPAQVPPTQAQAQAPQAEPVVVAPAEPVTVAPPASAVPAADPSARQQPTASPIPAAEAPVAQAPTVQAPTVQALPAQAPQVEPAPAPPGSTQAAEPTTLSPAGTPSAPSAPAAAEPPVPATTATPAHPAPTTAPTPEPAPAAATAPEPEPAAVPAAQAEPTQAEPAEDQSARQRAGSKKSAKGRRSSVPSWDEIMLGSSRQRD